MNDVPIAGQNFYDEKKITKYNIEVFLKKTFSPLKEIFLKIHNLIKKIYTYILGISVYYTYIYIHVCVST